MIWLTYLRLLLLAYWLILGEAIEAVALALGRGFPSHSWRASTPPQPSPQGHGYLHNSPSWMKGRDGILFASLDLRLQERFYHLVQEHVLNAAASGLSALPGTA